MTLCRGLHHRGHREHRARKEELIANSPEEIMAKGLTRCGPGSRGRMSMKLNDLRKATPVMFHKSKLKSRKGRKSYLLIFLWIFGKLASY
jgi:hypothetical protein